MYYTCFSCHDYNYATSRSLIIVCQSERSRSLSQSFYRPIRHVESLHIPVRSIIMSTTHSNPLFVLFPPIHLHFFHHSLSHGTPCIHCRSIHLCFPPFHYIYIYSILPSSIPLSIHPSLFPFISLFLYTFIPPSINPYLSPFIPTS